MIVNKTMYPLQTSFSVISQMQSKFSDLQVQLGTGQKSATLADMGRDLPLSLSVRSRLSTISGFQSNIDTVNLRLSFLNKHLSRFDAIEGEARNAAVPGQYGTNGINMATLPGLSNARLDEVVTMLNDDVAGRYLFGGSKTEKAPVADTKTLLDGTGGKAGFKAVVAQRRGADGVDDTTEPGRLTLGGTGAQVSLTEDGDHPFGFKLSTVSSSASTSSITITQPTAASPASLEVAFTAQPTTGDRFSFGLTLPDGTETQVQLTSSSETPTPSGSFAIGATPDDTAANMRAALKNALTNSAATELRAASTFAAATDFFSADGKPKIPAGSPKATSLVDGSATTVQWYTGEVPVSGSNPRQTVTAAVDDTTRVNYGITATETGFLNLVRSQAALAVSTYPSEEQVKADFEGDRLAAMALPEGNARTAALATYKDKVQEQYRRSTSFFDGMAQRQQLALSESRNSEPGSIELVTMDIGLAQAASKSASERHTAYKAQLDNLLSDVETVSKEDVAMEIMALQTRLTASYQVTSMVSKLSLVNFL